MVVANLSCMQRSLLAKLCCGTLPLEIEVGRFLNTKLRFCKICNRNVLENEYYFLFSCAPLQVERSTFYVRAIDDIASFMLMSDGDEVKFLLSESMIKLFSEWIEQMYYKRRRMVYRSF